MGGNIGDGLGGSQHAGSPLSLPGLRAVENGALHPLRSAYEAGFLQPEHASPDRIPRSVGKNADVDIQVPHIIFDRLAKALLHRRVSGRPGLSVHQLFPFSEPLIQRAADPVHQLHIQKPHQVKAKAVHVIFFRPVKHALQNELRAHGPLRRHVVSAGGAV